jgi:hypothetical protein
VDSHGDGCGLADVEVDAVGGERCQLGWARYQSGGPDDLPEEPVRALPHQAEARGAPRAQQGGVGGGCIVERPSGRAT